MKIIFNHTFGILTLIMLAVCVVMMAWQMSSFDENDKTFTEITIAGLLSAGVLGVCMFAWALSLPLA